MNDNSYNKIRSLYSHFPKTEYNYKMKSVLGFIFLVGCVAANFWDNLNSMRDAPVAPLP